MTLRAEPRGSRSIDWEAVDGKPDWAGRIWTVAAIVLIVAGFVGGMYLRTSWTGGDDEPAPAASDVVSPAPTPIAANG